MLVEARPVRTPASSLRTKSIWPSMRFLISACKALTSIPELLRGHECTDRFTHHDASDVARRLEVEDQDRQLIYHAKRDGGCIHPLQPVLQHLEVRDPIISGRVRVLDRIGGVD